VLPPILYGGAFLSVLALHWMRPLSIADYPTVLRWSGLVLSILAITVGVWARRTMHAAGTNISPLKPSTALVTSGPFRVTRNPLYLALTLLYLGLTLLLNTWWGMVVLVPLLTVMHNGVILREEYYLKQKFGETYGAYCARVRRYL
jgi:protein-S-isoprenylcysteine O-methyltransferase Ste14